MINIANKYNIATAYNEPLELIPAKPGHTTIVRQDGTFFYEKIPTEAITITHEVIFEPNGRFSIEYDND